VKIGPAQRAPGPHAAAVRTPTSTAETKMTTKRYSETTLPTTHGTLRMVVYRGEDAVEHVAMVAGSVHGANDVLCRVHSECVTSEVFGSLKCDCKQQLDRALDLIARRGRGVVLYLRGHEGRGIGLGDKVRAYALQEQGHDTVDANRLLGLPDEARDFSMVKAILDDLGIRSVALLTNNPLKVDALKRSGVLVTERVPHIVTAAPPAMRYLATKGARMGHMIDGPLDEFAWAAK
jgi:3,4-dihydroxy 2-butanone 4-phosphate synthase/GTP cyclohydrolase II